MPSSIESILDQISQARDQANAANERRYGQLLNLSKRRMKTLNAGLNRSQGTLERRVGETQALLESSGRGAKRDIRREGAEAGAQTTQQLINSGLYNSSTSMAMQQRQRESTQRQVDDVEERVSTQKAGTLAQTLGDLAGFQERAGAARSATIADKQGIIERRTDQQPNMDLYAQLLQAFGQGQGASGGGRSQTTIGRPPPPGGPSFGQGGTGGSGGGGSGAGAVDFGGVGSNSGSGGGSSSGRNTGIGFDPGGRGDYVTGGTAPVSGWYPDGSGGTRTVWVNAGQPVPGR